MTKRLLRASLFLAAAAFAIQAVPASPGYPDSVPAPFWAQTNGPCGGSVDKFLACPDGTVFALTEWGGLFRSTNHGRSWTRRPLPVADPPLECAVATPAGHVFIGTGGSGCFRSTDNGDTWTLARGGTDFKDLNVHSLAVNAKGWVYLFNYNGVFRSKNGGAAWSKVHGVLNAESKEIAAAIVNSKGQIFAATYNRGVYRSVDDGRNWTAVNSGLPTTPWIYGLAVDGQDRLFAASDGVFRSVDNGVSWSKVLSLPAMFTFSKKVNGLAVTPDGHILAGTYRLGVYRSANAGATWAPANTGLRDLTVRGVGADGRGYVYAGTSGGAGIYRSNESVIKWKKSNAGLVVTRVTVLAANASGYLFAGTAYDGFGGGMFRSTDGGTAWKPRGLPDKDVACVAVNGAGHIFVGTQKHGVLRSTNQGLSWIPVNAGLPSLLVGVRVQVLAINGAGQIFAGVLYRGIYRSNDNGATWTVCGPGLSNKGFKALTVAPNNDLFVADYNGVYRSTNNGGSWSFKGLAKGGVLSLLAKAGGVVFAGTNYGGVYVSTDSGNTWANKGVKMRALNAIAVNASGHVFVGGEGTYTAGVGVYKTVNNGASWTEVATGLFAHPSVLLVAPDGYLYAGTYHAGVFRSTSKVN